MWKRTHLEQRKFKTQRNFCRERERENRGIFFEEDRKRENSVKKQARSFHQNPYNIDSSFPPKKAPMASHAGGLIQDRNLNAHFNGPSAGGKTNVSKVPRKGGLGGRKPLSDVSNSVKRSPNQALKLRNSNIFPFTENETGASKITNDASKNKSVSKVQTGGRKALTDISNSGRPGLRNALKRNQNAKLSVVAEKTIHSSVIAEEQFLHNHQECIKARTKAMDMDEFLKTVGLDNDVSKQLASPWAPPVLSKPKPENSRTYLELDEMAELLIEDQSPQKHELSSKLESPPPCRTPRSPNHYIDWKDHDNIDFMLMETPELPKH